MTSRIIKKRDVVDILNEARLIREFSIYGCEEAPGKLFGYNPFSDKCVDITGYQGPGGPAVKPGGTKDKPKDGKRIGDTLSDVGGVLDFLKRVYLEAFDIDEILDCIEHNTAFSILGPIFGKTMVKILPKLAIWGAKKTYEVSTDSGRKHVELDKYVQDKSLKNQGFVSKWGSRAGKALDLWTKMLLSFKKLSFLGFAGIGYGIANYGAFGETGDEFVGWVDRKTVGEESDAAWKCFFSAAVLAVTAGLIIRGGAKGLLAITKKAGGSVKNGVAEIAKTDAFKKLIGESLDTAIKKVNSKDLLIFKVLQDTGQAPKNLRIIIDKGPNSVGLKLDGVSDFTSVIKIPVDEAPEALKKYADEAGQVILDPKRLSKDLTDISAEVNGIVHKLSDTNAAGMKESDLYKRLKALKKAAAQFGSSSPKTARAAAFKSSSKIIGDLSKRVEESVKLLDEMHKNIIKDDMAVQNIISRIQDAGENVDFNSLRKRILDAEPTEINKILQESLPGMNREAPQNFKQVTEYFQNTKDFDSLQKTTITDIELSRIALLEETGVVKNLFPGGSQTDDLSEWLSTPSGKPYEGLWLGVPGFSKRMRTYIKGRYFSAGLRRAVNTVFDNASFIGAYIGGAILLADIIWGERKQSPIDEREKKEILRISSEVMKDIRLEYYLENNKIKTKDLFLAILASKKFTDSNLNRSTKRAIEKVRKNLETDTQSLDIIDKHMNKKEATLPGKSQISLRVQSVLFTIFSPRQKGQDKDNDKEKKKTETNLMSQIPEGDLKKKSPFSLNINGVKTEVKFTNDYIQMDKKRFKFNHSTAGDAKIEKVFSEKKKNILKTQLSVNFLGKRVEKYSLTESDLQNLFLTMSKMNEGNKREVSLGGKTGNIIRMKDLNEVKIMNKKSLKELVTEVLNENYGQGYGEYPYNSNQFDEEEPREEYVEEWKSLELDVVQDKTRKVAIEIAKILVKDLELFNDVLDLAGQNQSVGTEILSKLKEARENTNT